MHLSDRKFALKYMVSSKTLESYSVACGLTDFTLKTRGSIDLAHAYLSLDAHRGVLPS